MTTNDSLLLYFEAVGFRGEQGSMSLFTSGFQSLKANSDLKQVRDYSCLSEERACKGRRKHLSVYLRSPTEFTAVFIRMMQTQCHNPFAGQLWPNLKVPRATSALCSLRPRSSHRISFCRSIWRPSTKSSK